MILIKLFLLSSRNKIINDKLTNLTVNEIKPKSGQSSVDISDQAVAEVCTYNGEHGLLPFDLSELERKPRKQTESQVTEKILEEVAPLFLKDLIDQRHFRVGNECKESIAVAFKMAQMNTSPLSPAIIEAALTMIIDRMNDPNTYQDVRYYAFRNMPFNIWYTHDYGIRIFRFQPKSE